MKPTRSTIAAVWIVCVISFFAVITLDAQRQEIRRSGVISSISDWLRDSGFLEAEDASAAKTALEIGASLALTETNAFATGIHDASTNAAQANAEATFAPLAGATFTGPISAPLLTIDTARQNIRSDLTHAGTVTLDFATNTSQFLVLTGNVEFAASNLGTNRSYFVTIANSQTTNCTVTMPAETVPMSFIPSAIAAGKHAWIFFTPHPQTNTLVFATFSEQP